MSFNERSPGVWRLRVPAGMDPVTGKRLIIPEEVHGSRRAAKERHDEILAEVKRGQRARHSPSLRATISEWRKQAQHARSTSRNYDLAIKTIPAPFLATTIDKLRASAIRELYQRVKDQHGVHRTRQVHAVVSGALTFAWRQEWIPANPARRVQPPTQPRRKATAPTDEQVSALVEHVADRPEFHAWLLLSAMAGGRRSELLALHWSDLTQIEVVQPDGSTMVVGRLSIDKALEPIGSPDEKPTKTEDERVLALGAATVAVLRRWRVAFLERAMAVGIKPVEDPYIFTNDIAGLLPWRPDTATKRFIRLRRKVGVECRLHDLRHYMVTKLLLAGKSAKEAGERAGHKRTATTTDMYGHLMPATDTANAEVLERGITAG